MPHSIAEESIKSHNKCRIPLRLTQDRPLPPVKDTTRNRLTTNVSPPSRSRSLKDDHEGSSERASSSQRAAAAAAALHRTDKDLTSSARAPKPSTIPKRIGNFPTYNRNSMNKYIKPGTGPGSQKSTRSHRSSHLPDQETIKREEQELLQENDTDLLQIDPVKGIILRPEKINEMKTDWHKKLSKFENMKRDLIDRQKALLHQYNTLTSIHEKMTSLGQKIKMPPSENLQIMNISQLNPEEVLQLAANVPKKGNKVFKDLTKLYSLPTNMVELCEETLAKRSDIIKWIETLTMQPNNSVLHSSKINKRVNEFKLENEMLLSSLDKVKAMFHDDIKDIVQYLRNCLNDAMVYQLRSEQATYQTTKLNSQIADLQKQVHANEHLKLQVNKTKMEELNKELKQELHKNETLKKRLAQAEGQEKMSTERATQLEIVLEQAQSQVKSLEATVEKLQIKNETLQRNCDTEIKKLTESINENTVHLEDIADVREKLQTEKEDVERRLDELSENYNESLKNMKQEQNNTVASLIEVEKKYEEEKREREKIESKVETLYSQLVETQLRHKNVLKLLKEKEIQINKSTELEEELKLTKRDVQIANEEIESYKNKLMKQNETIKDIEREFIEMQRIEDDFKKELTKKDAIIVKLETQQLQLEEQIKESETKMVAYEEQMTSLKQHIAELQADFGEFENLQELHEIINQQRSNLLEATRQNGELAEALQEKDRELERQLETLSEQVHVLEEKDGLIKTLSEKEQKQEDIIKLLKTNLELRAQGDADLSQQLSDKNSEIETLLSNLDTRKQQITQLEKIIHALEDQVRKHSFQKKKDHDKISTLEKKIMEYESYFKCGDNLDNLIKILEDELGMPIDCQPNEKVKQDYHRGNIDSQRRREDSPNLYHSDSETKQTKVALGNNIKKTYNAKGNDNLDRKKAITNMETQKRRRAVEPGLLFPEPEIVKEKVVNERSRKDMFLTRNIPFLLPIRDDRRCKMFKLAGHRL